MGKSERSLFSVGISGVRSLARGTSALRKLPMNAVSLHKSAIEEPESFIDETLDKIALWVLATLPVEVLVSPSIRSMRKFAPTKARVERKKRCNVRHEH